MDSGYCVMDSGYCVMDSGYFSQASLVGILHDLKLVLWKTSSSQRDLIQIS
jgi:hypothetical protein